MTTKIIITDTGKRRTTSATAEETDKANSGSALTLNGVEITVEEQSILNTSPSVLKLSTPSSPGTKYAAGEVDHLGVHKPKWTIRGVLNDQSGTDLAVIKALRELVRTKGFKTVGGDVADYMDGTANSSTVNVHIAGYTLTHRANSNIIDYQLTAYETD